MAQSTLSGGSRVSREFWGQLARASPEDPLWVLASDDEITKVSRLDRAALEKLRTSEATSFESSFVLWKHTGLGEYEKVISIDILCLDPYVQGELLGAELARLREGDDRNRARNGIAKVLRGLKLGSCATPKELLQQIHRELPARLAEIHALTAISTGYGCVLVAKPGDEFAMVLRDVPDAGRPPRFLRQEPRGVQPHFT